MERRHRLRVNEIGGRGLHRYDPDKGTQLLGTLGTELISKKANRFIQTHQNGSSELQNPLLPRLGSSIPQPAELRRGFGFEPDSAYLVGATRAFPGRRSRSV